MDIKTKYKVGDHVWIMRDNKPTEIMISRIGVAVEGLLRSGTNWLSGEISTRIVYTEIQRKEYRSMGDKDPEYSYLERECFPTKRALLDSFMEEGE